MPEPPKLLSFHPSGALDSGVYDRMLTDSDIGVCVWRLETPGTPSSLRLVACNPRAGRFLSVTPSEVLGKRIHEGFPGSERMPLAQLFTEVIERGEARFLGEVPYLDTFGNGMYSIHAFPLPHRQCCVEFTNITERVRAERQVAERTEILTRTLAELWSEMDLARKIQTVLVPRHPRVRGYEVAAQMRPAASVGGDYVDVFEEAGFVWMLIGDVSGRGISAGLTMMMVQTAVRSVITSLAARGLHPAPSAVLDAVNTALGGNLQLIGQDQYMTINALRLEGGAVVHAGLHQDILVHRAATGVLDRFESEGLWLGVFSDASKGLVDQQFALAEGDTLLLFTDGITEARGPLATDGQRRLEAHFSELAAAGLSCEEMVQRILDRARESGPDDDTTALVARRRGRLRMPTELELSIPNLWPHVREIRQRVGERLSSLPVDLRRATEMVASELLENAIKYGEPVPECPRIRLTLRVGEGRIELEVSNGVRSPGTLERLREGLELMEGPMSPEALYRQRLERLLTAPGTVGRLGLVRIWFEGGFTLAASLSGEVLTVIASRALEST